MEFKAARRSEAEEPPLRRCSKGEEREEAAHCGGLKPTFRGGVRRSGSLQPRPFVREARSAGFCGEEWLDSLDDASEVEVESVGAGGGGVEDVVGCGLIAARRGVVDSDRIDWQETELLQPNCLLAVHRTVLDGLSIEVQEELCARTSASAALRSSIGLS